MDAAAPVPIHPEPPAPEWVRRGLFPALLAALLAAAALLGLELGARGLHLWLLGTPFEARQARAEVLGTSPGLEALLTLEPEHVRASDPLVPHPYLGYAKASWLKEVEQELAPDRIPKRDPGTATVLLLGGSVAQRLDETQRGYLAAGIRATRFGAGREVRILPFAQGGYKQPQQLHALNWYLALGGDADLVLQLDGFNEIALGATENLPFGVSVAYPRSWHVYAHTRIDAASMAAAGDLGRARDRLRIARSLVSRFPGPDSALILTAARLLARAGRCAEVAAIHAIARAQAGTDGTVPVPLGGPVPASRDEAASLRESVAIWERSTRLTAVVADRAGATHLAFLQPNQYDPGQKPIGPDEARVALGPESAFARLVPPGYRLLAAAGERMRADGIAFVDLRAALADHPEPLYEDSCCHLTPAGYRVLADAILARVAALPAQDPAAVDRRLPAVPRLEAGTGPVVKGPPGEPPPGPEGAWGFTAGGGLAGPGGSVYRVEPGAGRGFVESLVTLSGRVRASGWCLDSSTGEPAERVLLMAGDRGLGVGRPTAARPDVLAAYGLPGPALIGFALSVPIRAVLERESADLRVVAVFASGVACVLPRLP